MSLSQIVGQRMFAQTSARCFSSAAAQKRFKVSVVGAAGGIGQPLSLLLKQSDCVSELSLYDVAPVTKGVGVDLSHIPTPARIRGGYSGPEQLSDALAGSDLVVVPAGMPRKPGMTRDDLFNANAKIIADIAKIVSNVAPNAFFLIITNPVNSTVPIAAEILKKAGKYNPRKVFGVTTLDVFRANTFISEHQKFDVKKTHVPVIGGHAGITILPLLSQVQGGKFSAQETEALTKRIAFGGDEVVAAKVTGSATLSMAAAAAHFAERVLLAARGEKGIVECAYVESTVGPTKWFASPVELGVDGVQKIPALPKLNEFETNRLKELTTELDGAIKKGIEFAKTYN